MAFLSQKGTYFFQFLPFYDQVSTFLPIKIPYFVRLEFYTTFDILPTLILKKCLCLGCFSTFIIKLKWWNWYHYHLNICFFVVIHDEHDVYKYHLKKSSLKRKLYCAQILCRVILFFTIKNKIFVIFTTYECI